MKRIVFALLLLVVGFRLAYPYMHERLPNTFSIDHIASDLYEDLPTYELPDLSWMQDTEFRYIGHGGEAIAFESEDGKFVLKLFLQKSLHGKRRLELPKPTHWIPSHQKARREERQAADRRSLLSTLRNYAAVADVDPTMAAIVALHLTPSEGLPTTTLVDFNGQSHAIDLNRAAFVLQHKVELIVDALARLTREQVAQTMQEFFTQRGAAGFQDVEKTFMIEQNYGLYQGKPVQIDVGKIVYSEKVKQHPNEEIAKMRQLLLDWTQFVQPQ